MLCGLGLAAALAVSPQQAEAIAFDEASLDVRAALEALEHQGSVVEQASEFSVLELPPVEGDGEAQMAVHWAGTLPAWLEAGSVDREGVFQAVGEPQLLTESMSLVALPPLPNRDLRWRLVDTDGQVLAQQSAATGSQWLLGFGAPALSGAVWAMTVFQGELIVGGGFVTIGDQVVNHIARWNGTQWLPLAGPSGTGVNNRVNALTVYNGELVVGGIFTTTAGTAGGVLLNRVARWNGNDWLQMAGDLSGIGTDGGVFALTIHNGELISGGGFLNANSIPANGVVRWTGSDWAPLGGASGTGVIGSVWALTVYDGQLVVGGNFTSAVTTAGFRTVNHIARWTGSDWLPLAGPSGTGVNSSVRALTVYNGELVVGGDFTTAGGVTVNRIARRTGSNWLPLAGPSRIGVNGSVWALTVYNGELVVGGFFTTAGGVTANRVVRWNDAAWRPMAGPLANGVDGVSGPVVRALQVYGGKVYAGGIFGLAGGLAAVNLAAYVIDEIMSSGFE